MKILVLEHTLPFGRALRKVLKDGRRHKVLLAEGLTDIEGQVVAKTHDGRSLSLDLDEYDLVLVDGNVPDGLVASDEVVKRLSKQGVSCVAISALPEANKALVEAGAKLHVRKHVLICGMAAKLMEKSELTLASPIVQARLETMDKVVSGDKLLRRQGDDIVSRFLKTAA